MITDDERREAARRLRDKKAECEERGYPWMCDDLILALGYDHDYEAGDEIFDRLADLIEPSEPSGHECVPGECPLNVRHDGDFIDREALLALADEMEEFGNLPVKHPGIRVLHNDDFSRELGYARRIREAVGA